MSLSVSSTVASGVRLLPGGTGREDIVSCFHGCLFHRTARAKQEEREQCSLLVDCQVSFRSAYTTTSLL